ncbi:MAG: hypothetical protein WCJ84_01695 [Candidatus Peregrinibacteria bacterium]
MQSPPFRPAFFSEFLSRLFSGIGGGLLGTSASLLVFVLFSYAQNNAQSLGNTAEFSGLGILAVVFSGSLIGNLFATFFHTIASPERYTPRSEVMKYVFSVNLFLFLTALPFYLLAGSSESLLTIAAIHFFLSASASLLAVEMMAGKDYGIMAIIAISIVQLFVLSVYFFLPFGSYGPMLPILFLPLIWALLPFMVFVVEKIRGGMWNAFGYDIFGAKS